MLENKRRGLGKTFDELGLSELLSDLNTPMAPLTENNPSNLRTLPVDLIQPGRYQPRQVFDSESLQELADSIKAQGIIQPLIVRSISPSRYEIIAGERRWRAAQIAGLNDLPVIIREMTDEAALAIALIENIQRENLNPVDEAQALQRLIDEFTMTHQQVAEAVGKSRSTVTNLLRLLSLNPDIQARIQRQELELGHAKVLLPLDYAQQIQLAELIATKKLSVRETEKIAKQMQHNTNHKKPTHRIDPNIAHLQAQLSDILAAAVEIKHQNKGHGKLIIQYHNLDELEGILAHIK